jgi:hypothetical protein
VEASQTEADGHSMSARRRAMLRESRNTGVEP